MRNDIQAPRTLGGTSNAVQSYDGPVSESKVARERGAIEQEQSNQFALLDELHNVITQLEERLEPVSTAVPQSDGKPDSHEYLGSSAVYSRLHESNDQLYNATTRLRRIKSYLEV